MGDSERRQLTLAKNYCAANGLRLSDLAFADKGISAYHGKHRENGALGRLLKHVQPGDVILIEDTDRWSREDPLDALLCLRAEVQNGVEIAFLRTGVRVTKENFSNPAVLYPNFFGAVLGNAENKKKSERIKSVWETKKAIAASGKPVRMNRLPCWLEWDEKQDKPVVLEAKANTVRQMFDWACEGHGLLEICRKLLAAGTAPITTSKHPAWNVSSIRHLLTNRAATGHYTHTDPPTANVWPPIIDEKTFCVAQTKLEIARKQTRRGGSQVNLFTKIAICARCGQFLVAHTSNQGDDPRLVCGGASSGKSTCDFKTAPLPIIEMSFLGFLAENDLVRSMLTTKEAKPSKLEELRAQLVEAEKQIAKLSKAFLGDDDPPKILYSALKREQSKAKELQAAIEFESIRVKGETPGLVAYEAFRDTLADKAKDPEFRLRLRQAVHGLVKKMVLDPHGQGNGTWSYELWLKDANEAVTIIVNVKSKGWLFRLLRPVLRHGGC